jgi:signal peptidase I
MKKNAIWEFTKAIVSALILAFVIRATVVQAYKIPSGSMIPTLLIGDHLLANKFIYGEKVPFLNKKLFVFRKPERGDIVIFPCPVDPGKNFIKRVVAVEGDAVEESNKQLFINGKPVSEPYVQHTDNFMSIQRDNFGPYLVPHNKVFVMGDNRDHSLDSRFWGYVKLDHIAGRASIIYWSEDFVEKSIRIDRIGMKIR